MNSLPIEIKEIGDYRISIYYDEHPECPTKWSCKPDKYLWEYSGNIHELSADCNWDEVYVKEYLNGHSLLDAVRDIASCRLIPSEIIKYCKAHFADCWCEEYEDEEYSDYDIQEELLERLSVEELVQLLNDSDDDFFIKEWSSSGYSQGEYVQGVAFCSKKDYIEYINDDTTDWKQKIDIIIDQSIDTLGMWMWGDVKGFVLERKYSYTKIYDDPSQDDEEGFDWKEIDSCWGYYESTEVLIDEVISEYDLLKEIEYE